MPIIPLPRFEAEADPVRRGLSEEDLRAYEALEPPRTVVVRFGDMGLIGEYPCSLDAVPGCGTKFVVKTHRGTEIGEMLTTTCANSGCGKSVSRQEMLDYIENSGGKQYPFSTNGRILRIATVHDLAHMEKLDELRKRMLTRVREIAAQMQLSIKIVGIEPILGEELVTVYYLSEERIDFAQVVPALARELLCRVEMRQIGPREEARLNADYERCGQHCCCRQFLKVLKPVSMKSAKMQKGTLDPMKISGRCGRLMCCLRYEDVTYQELKRNLPHKRTRVGTPDGPGIVLSSQILTQLVLVQLESDGSSLAVPVESLCDPDHCPVKETHVEDPLRGMSASQIESRSQRQSDQRRDRQDQYRKRSQSEQADVVAAEMVQPQPEQSPDEDDRSSGKAQRKRRRRRGGRNRRGRGAKPADAQQDQSASQQPAAPPSQAASTPPARQNPPDATPATDQDAKGDYHRRTRRGKRRRRGRRGGRGGAGGGDGGGGPGKQSSTGGDGGSGAGP